MRLRNLWRNVRLARRYRLRRLRPGALPVEVEPGRVPAERSGDLGHAVQNAAAAAEPGDVVLLAPACASFDQFEGFEARGDAFRDAVRVQLETGARS